MQDYSVFVLLYVVFALFLNESYGTEDQVECNDPNSFRVLERCCNNIPDEELLTEEDKAAGLMCDQTVFGNRTAPLTDEERLELYECMDECFYKATQLLTADMKLNETALIAEYDTPLENYPQWKEPMAKAVKTCIEKNVVLDVKPEAKCKSGAYQFSNCFGVNLYLNCPPENRKMDDECTKARERLEKC